LTRGSPTSNLGPPHPLQSLWAAYCELRLRYLVAELSTCELVVYLDFWLWTCHICEHVCLWHIWTCELVVIVIYDSCDKFVVI
jgi:hypothetical protein